MNDTDGLDSFDGFTRRAAAAGMFNDDQVGYMQYLSSLPREAKCACGWDRKGECYNCNTGELRRRGLPSREGYRKGSFSSLPDTTHWQLPDGRWVEYREAVEWLTAREDDRP